MEEEEVGVSFDGGEGMVGVSNGRLSRLLAGGLPLERLGIRTGIENISVVHESSKNESTTRCLRGLRC